MKRWILALTSVLCSPLAAQAATLHITCGQNAYESLDTSEVTPPKPELLLVLKVRGPEQPAEVLDFVDDYSTNLSNKVAKMTTTVSESGVRSVTVAMKNYDKYEFTQIRGCADIDTAAGDVAFTKYVGGFAGYAGSIKAKCSCLKK